MLQKLTAMRRLLKKRNFQLNCYTNCTPYSLANSGEKNIKIAEVSVCDDLPTSKSSKVVRALLVKYMLGRGDTCG